MNLEIISGPVKNSTYWAFAADKWVFTWIILLLDPKILLEWL